MKVQGWRGVRALEDQLKLRQESSGHERKGELRNKISGLERSENSAVEIGVAALTEQLNLRKERSGRIVCLILN